jgi:hypothetical protein
LFDAASIAVRSVSVERQVDDGECLALDHCEKAPTPFNGTIDECT